MVSDNTWHVLVEEESKNSWGEDNHRWGLAGRHPARDEEHARALAAELAGSHVPSLLRSRRPYRRLVHRLAGDVWLAVLESASGTLHVRVSVAQLVAVHDHEPSRRGVLGRLTGPE
ncbi:hypothetical protein [Kitasatospora sp. NPDC057223]|uniref:hypothetical protein n=1 Tax=Kitasatospora sp. NPDC057223 TaxID=3346055 RepID=UPI0036457E4B